MRDGAGSGTPAGPSLNDDCLRWQAADGAATLSEIDLVSHLQPLLRDLEPGLSMLWTERALCQTPTLARVVAVGFGPLCHYPTPVRGA